jgi:CYTH domain-containing protein
MTLVRRFLLASSLARLIAGNRGSTSITEGYFAAQQGRVSYVALDGERARLVLTSELTESASVEERTDIPRAHAEALLDVCAGRVTLERSTFPIDGGAEVLIERITQPGVITTVTVEFHNPDESEAFTPPTWFGAEITTEPSFGRQVIALDRLPEVPEVPLSNAMVEAVLDLLEGRAPLSQPVTTPARPPSIETSVLEALSRLSASGASGGPTAPPEAHEASPEPQMPDSELTGYVPGAHPSESAGRDKVHPVDPAEPSPPSRIRPRLFPRLTN